MTTATKYTNTGAAGAEVHVRAERHMSTKGGTTYQEAVHAVLTDDKQLAEAYARTARASGPWHRNPRCPYPPRLGWRKARRQVKKFTCAPWRSEKWTRD